MFGLKGLAYGVVTGGQGMWALRAGMGSCCDDGSLHLVPLIVPHIGSLKWTVLWSFSSHRGKGAMWLVQVNKGVMEGEVFCSLPQATWGGRGRTSEGIYV